MIAKGSVINHITVIEGKPKLMRPATIVGR